MTAELDWALDWVCDDIISQYSGIYSLYICKFARLATARMEELAHLLDPIFMKWNICALQQVLGHGDACGWFSLWSCFYHD